MKSKLLAVALGLSVIASMAVPATSLAQIAVTPCAKGALFNTQTGQPCSATTSTGSTATCLIITHNLFLGSSDKATGGEVTKLQKFLKQQGDYTYPTITGYFGSVTRAALLKFQLRTKVVTLASQGGSVGVLTRAKIKGLSCTVVQAPGGGSGTVVVIQGSAVPAAGMYGGSSTPGGSSNTTSTPNGGGNNNTPGTPATTFTINATAGTGGSISPGGTISVSQGNNQTFSITPTAGYQITSVLVDGVSIGSASSYTFLNVSGNHSISVSYVPTPTQPTTYTITASAGTNGAISPSGIQTVNSGSSQTYNFTPNSGYQISSVIVDGSSVGSPSSYTFPNITGNHTISVSFSLIQQVPVTYSVTASAGSGGSISPTGTNTVNQGTAATYTITANTGFQVNTVTVDGVNKGNISSYTFPTTSTGSHTISATFSAVVVTYNITASAGTGGSISPSGTVSVNSGASKTFTITPAAGNQISSVTVNGVNQGAIGTYTFTNVTSNQTISATFAPLPTYTITASAGANGSISPSGSVSVTSGNTQNFTVTPNSGYQTASVLVDGVAQAIAATYSFTGVSANHTISATFSQVVQTPPPTQTGTGNTYYVATSGSDSNSGSQSSPFATIQKGASVLKAGDTLDVEPGTYAGFVIGWDSTGLYGTIAGTSGNPVTIQADPSAAAGSVIVNSKNAKTSDAIDFESGADYVILKGFTVQNGGTVTRDGIRVVSTTGTQILNNNVSGTNRFGIFSSFGTNILVQGNTVHNIQGSSSTTGHGMYISNSAVNPTIRGNVIYSNTTQGLHMNGDVSQGGVGIITGAIVEGNLIYNNAANGINGDGVQSSRFQNNIIYGNGKNGIVLYQIDASAGPKNDIIVNNTINQPSGTAVRILNGGTGGTIRNNILLGQYSIGVTSDSVSGLTSDYNATVNNVYTNEDTGTVNTLAQRQTAGQETHSFVATASQLFVNSASNDYHLSATSPAIDKGTSASAPATDFSGASRPSGNGYDIGAYEYGGVVQTPTTYTITVSSGANGSISPSTTQVNSGASQTFTITPNTGYQIASVTLDGVAQTISSTVTLSGVTANHTLTATFSVAPPGTTYTITASAGTGGTISPTGSVSVTSGSSKTFTISPSSGYQIASVTVNGVSQGAIGTYTFTNVTSNQTISATFSQTTSPPPSGSGTTYYISPTGSDTTGNGSYASPWATMRKVYTIMKAGDTIVLKNGTYHQLFIMSSDNGGEGPVSGTASQYTTIKAETDYQVVVDGDGVMSPINVIGTHTGYTLQYMTIQGIVFRHQATGASLYAANHIKLIRDGFEDSCDGNCTTVDIGQGNDYILVEDCFAWGNGRYKFGTYYANHVVFRRDVLRFDRDNPHHNGVSEPMAGFAIYSSNNVDIQNSIVIDSDHPEFWITPDGIWGAFFVPTTSDPSNNVTITGSIALNDAFGFGGVDWGATPVISNSVGWHVQEGSWDRNSASYNHITLGDLYGPALETGKVGIDYYPGSYGTPSAPTMFNSIMQNVKGTALSNVRSEDYNVLYGNTANYSSTPAGTHTITNQNPSLKYITRIEPDNATLHGTANDGGDRGANILYQIGTSGTFWGDPGYNTLTSQPLWPFPNEDSIGNYMRSYSYTGPTASGATATLSGNRGFAATGQTLTNYIWGYLGNPTPYGAFVPSGVVQQPTTYTITASAGANGSISPLGNVSVTSGNSQSFTLTPNSGYQIASVTLDGVAQTTSSTVTLSNVTANHTLSVTFSAVAQNPATFTVTPSAGANGSISPGTSQTVNSGGSLTFTITPNSGYQIASVALDGINQGTGSSLTLTNVTANHTVSATFSQVVQNPTTYTITASAGANGTISPNSASVTSGGSQNFTITPNTGYQISSVTLDGVAQANASPLTLSNITSNHTISVTFSQVAQTPPPQGGSGPVGHWTFDGAVGDVVVDSGTAGSALNGTFEGSPTYVAGKVGNAAKFDGFSYIDLNSGSHSVLGGLSAMTIGGWVKWTANDSTFRGWFSSEGDTNSTADCPSLELGVKSGSFGVWEGNSSCNTALNATTPIPSALNNWHYLTFVVDGTGNRMYVDGIRQTPTYTAGSAANTFALSGVSPTAIDFIGTTADSSTRFKGQIDEVTVYNRALSDSEVATLASGGTVSANTSASTYNTASAITSLQNMLETPGITSATTAYIQSLIQELLK